MGRAQRRAARQRLTPAPDPAIGAQLAVSPAPSRRSRGLRLTFTVFTVLMLLMGAAVVYRLAGERLVLHERCEANAGEHSARVTVEQAANAATIAAVAARRGLPARAATIALATAMQESKLRNLDYGDRDSLGLFQQRPSQGWGTAEEVMDPVHAAESFYDELVKIDGYKTMDINDAAQKVQRSGHPQGYAKHESRARALASTLMGYSPAGFACSIRPASYEKQEARASGLTPRAAAALAAVEKAFGDQVTGGYAPGGVADGHMEGSAHYDGRAVDIFYKPANDDTRRAGWATAHWLVAHAEELGIATVIYDGRIWTARRSPAGWRDYTPPSGPTSDATLMHRDHVHLDVALGK